MAKIGKHSRPEAEKKQVVSSGFGSNSGSAGLHEAASSAEAAFATKVAAASASGVSAPAAALAPNQLEGEKRSAGKTVAIVCGIVAGVLAVVYLAGVVAFSFLFLPNTTIGGNDISLKTSDDVRILLDDAAESYAFAVEGQGISLAMTSREAGIVYETDAILSEMHARESAWKWPYEVFQQHDMADCAAISYENSALEDALRAAAAEVNETATPPIDATIGYDAEAGKMVVVPEQYGTLVDADKLIAYVKVQNNELNEKIELPQEVLATAELTQDDERLARAAETANSYLTVDVNLIMNGQAAAAVNPETMSSWITLSENLEAVLDETLMTDWVTQTAAACTTTGSQRAYTRPDGKQVTVEGGDYGWTVDEEALLALVTEAVQSGQQGDVEMPLSQTAQAFNGYGAADWGARYVDIDLSEQHAYFYDESGSLIWESDVVTGGPGAGRATPTGVWDLNSNNGRTTLVGRKADGSVDYETPVSYWMPFVRQSIGLHDANWRGSFGGSIYTYSGSHGCVNLPVSKAKELHSLIEVGDVVITHW